MKVQTFKKCESELDFRYRHTEHCYYLSDNKHCVINFYDTYSDYYGKVSFNNIKDATRYFEDKYGFTPKFQKNITYDNVKFYESEYEKLNDFIINGKEWTYFLSYTTIFKEFPPTAFAKIKINGDVYITSEFKSLADMKKFLIKNFGKDIEFIEKKEEKYVWRD